MAFTPTSVTNLKPKRGGTQFDTVGEVATKSFSFVIPAGSTATTAELTAIKLPANAVITGFWQKANVASTANSTLAFKTTTANLTFANATALTTSWAKVSGANDTTVYTTAEDTVTAVIGTATEANAVTVTATIAYLCLGTESASYSTFTI